MRRTIALTAAALLVAALAAPPAGAHTYGSASKAATYGSGSRRTTITAFTSGYTRDFACGFLHLYDCATVKDIYGRVSVQKVGSSARYPAIMKISVTAGFQGVGLAVGVMYPVGVTLGFTDAGRACKSPELESGRRARSVSFRATGEICKAKTAGWVSKITTTTNGYYRYGNRWYVITAVHSRTVGGL